MASSDGARMSPQEIAIVDALVDHYEGVSPEVQVRAADIADVVLEALGLGENITSIKASVADLVERHQGVLDRLAPND